MTVAALENSAAESRYAPRRPLLLPQLMHAVSDDATSRRELANVISRDPALVGNLLQLANSPFYRVNAQPVESIDRAVALLGTEGIRSLIAKALVQPVFRIGGGEFAKFPEIVWEHTFRSASAAEAHAAVIEDSDPFAAQLLALVAGLGDIVVFRVALDQYKGRPGLRPTPAVIASLLDAHRASVAHRVAASWDLSGRILAALQDQVPGLEMHEPTSLGRSLQFGRFVGALTVLQTNGILDEDGAKAALLAGAGSGPHVERIWGRLTGQPATPAR